MTENISISDALELILSKCKTIDYELVSYRRALHRIIREDIKATTFNPPSDNSAMDGYGVIASDCANTPVKLKIMGVVLAGEQYADVLRPGQAIKIMTGASIPEGVNAVVPFEETEEYGETVIIKKKVREGENIRRKGEDYKSGDLLIKSGKKILPADIAILASIGKIKVQVSKKPIIAIISTGNELVAPEESFLEGKIKDSNSYGLEAQVENSGAIADVLGIAVDEKQAIKEYIEKAMR